jgi:hypothetical protein
MATIDRNVAPAQIEGLVLSSFFSHEPYLSRFFVKLAQREIFTVGDILPYSRATLFELFPTSEPNRQAFVTNLQKVGVHL